MFLLFSSTSSFLFSFLLHRSSSLPPSRPHTPSIFVLFLFSILNFHNLFFPFIFSFSYYSHFRLFFHFRIYFYHFNFFHFHFHFLFQFHILIFFSIWFSLYFVFYFVFHILFSPLFWFFSSFSCRWSSKVHNMFVQTYTIAR